MDRASAQADDEKAQLVQQIIDLHIEERYLERMFKSASRVAPEGRQEAFQDIMARVDQGRIYADLAESVDQLYTTEELRAYLEFASSDIGRSMLRKKAQMSEKLYEAITFELLKAATSE